MLVELERVVNGVVASFKILYQRSSTLVKGLIHYKLNCAG